MSKLLAQGPHFKNHWSNSVEHLQGATPLLYRVSGAYSRGIQMFGTLFYFTI